MLIQLPSSCSPSGEGDGGGVGLRGSSRPWVSGRGLGAVWGGGCFKLGGAFAQVLLAMVGTGSSGARTVFSL